MGDLSGSSDETEAPQSPQEHEQQQQRSGNIYNVYTVEMFMEERERLSRSDGAVCAGVAAALLETRGAGTSAFAPVDPSIMVEVLLRNGRALNVTDDKGFTYLTDAASTGLLRMTKAFLAAGADPTIRCDCGMSPLDWACAGGHVEAATVLIAHGVELDGVGIFGRTPLHYGARAGRAEIVRLLCSRGADVDKVDGLGSTPLERAIYAGHDAATRALLDAGADATLRRAVDDRSPLDWAASSAENPGILGAIIDRVDDVNAANALGVTALHIAAVHDNAEAVDALVAAGADVEAEDASGASALCDATREGSRAAALALLRHGASVGKQDAAGRTPLHLAAAKAGKRGAAEVVDQLLRRGADEKTTDNEGQSAIEVIGVGWAQHGGGPGDEDVERVRQLLANAPADRAWRRHGFLVMCRARYPSGRVRLGHGKPDRDPAANGKKNRCFESADPSRTEANWAGVAGMLMGVGDDPISLMGNGADLIFETIMRFL